MANSFNGTPTDVTLDHAFTPSQTIVDIILQRAQETPNDILYTFLQNSPGQQHLTYGQLANSAKHLSAMLQQRGLAGERILLIFKSNYNFIISFFACLMAGAVAVPTAVPKRNHLASRLKVLVDDAQARAAIVDSDEVGKDAFGAQTFDLFDTRKIDWDNSQADQWQKPALTHDSLAFLQYTSGSTGDPKGVMVSHGNVIANSIAIQKGLGHSKETIALNAMPLFHDMGLINGVIQPLFVGNRMYLMSPVLLVQEPHRWLQLISELRVTSAGGPNFLYEMASQSVKPSDIEGIDLSSWKVAYCGAEPIRSSTVELFKSTFAPYGFHTGAFFPCYGLAEATVFVSGNPLHRPPRVDMYEDRSNENAPTRAIVSCGVAVHETEIVIVDPQTKTAVVDGEQGEIWVKSKSVAQGYWRKQDVTEQTFQARIEGDTEDRQFLRTGDMGYIKENELYVSGRLKDLIILYGQNYAPQDLELAAENSHTHIRSNSSAAFTISGGDTERLILVVELKRTALRRRDDWPEIIRQASRAILHSHQLEVDEVVLLKPGTLPKTSSGKVQRRRCRDAYLAGELERVGIAEMAEISRVGRAEDQAPSTHTVVATDRADRRRRALTNHVALTHYIQESLAQQLAIDIDQVDLNQGFFDLGMDSLMAVKFRNHLEKSLGIELPATLLLDHSNAHGLIEFLASHTSEIKLHKAPVHEGVVSPIQEPLAVVGMSCRFPKAESPQQFWRLLSQGESAIGPIPEERWDKEAYYDPDPNAPGKMYVQHGGFIDQIDQFDADFFGISPREANYLDPQQRLLLEQTWLALEDASIDSDQLKQYVTSVFVGIVSSDYGHQLMHQGEGNINAYVGTGNTASAASGRLSYFLGLRGSAVSIDTACASSLTALHYAAENLNRRESQIAIVAGVNVILSPETTINCCKANMLSKDGQCKSFDDSADGYVRSEGAGVVILKRLSDAVASGDTIHAVIRGTAINHNGHTSGFTVPSGSDQQNVIRHALEKAGLKPGDIDYVEAQGTGSPLGDPIELNALSEVFKDSHTQQRPLHVGTAKTNIGHLEAAAGMAGLIKVILGLRNQQIPANLHFNHPSRHVEWSKLPIRVPTTLQPWLKNNGPRRAGVSAFGFSGSNAHVIVEEAPEIHHQAHSEYSHEAPEVIVLSAKNKEALNELAIRYAKLYEEQPEKWKEIAFDTQTRRHHFQHRLAFIADSAAQAQQVLQQFAAGENVKDIFLGKHNSKTAANIGMLFDGDGVHYPREGGSLYKNEPVFKEIIDRCDRAFMRIHPDGQSLKEILYGEKSALMQQPSYSQPALFAVEMALYCLWTSWGVRPHALFGHGAGELASACAARIFNIDNGVLLATHRGRLMQTPDSMEYKNAFNEVVARIHYYEPQCIFISTVTGEPIRTMQQQQWVDYWTASVIAKNEVNKGIESLKKTDCTTLLEVGPTPGLKAIAGEQSGAHWLTSLLPNVDDEHAMLTSLAQLYTLGVDINWQRVNPYRPAKHVALPAYPFQRQRYWFEKNRLHPGAKNAKHPLLGERVFLLGSKEIRYQHILHRDQLNALGDQSMIPVETISSMVWEAARRLPIKQDKIFLHHVNLLQPIAISKSGQLVQLIIDPIDLENYQFSVISLDVDHLDNSAMHDARGVLHATGEIGEMREMDAEIVFHEKLKAAPEEHHYSLMTEHVGNLFIKVVGLRTDEIDHQQPFSEFGMDSLMAAEFRNYLNKTLGFSIPITTIIDHPTINQLSRFLIEQHKTSDNPATSQSGSLTTNWQQGEL